MHKRNPDSTTIRINVNESQLLILVNTLVIIAIIVLIAFSFWLLARYGHLGKVINIIRDYYRNRFRNLLPPQQQQQQLHSQITYHGQLLSSPSAPLFLTNSAPVQTDFNKRNSINLSSKPEPCQTQDERNSVQFQQARLK